MIQINSSSETQEYLNRKLILGLISETTFEERKEMRNQEWFKSRYHIWHNSSIRKQGRIGSLMTLIDESKAESFEGWVEYYFSNFTSFTKFKALCEEASGILKLSLKGTLYYLWIHIIDFCWEGKSYEDQALVRLKEKFPERIFKRASQKEDKQFGIDFTVWDTDNNLVGAVQVKGFTYFLGKNAKERITKHTNGYTEFFQKTGIRIQYLIKETVFDDQEIKLFPVQCFGDTVAIDYSSIIPAIIPSVHSKSVVKIF